MRRSRRSLKLAMVALFGGALLVYVPLVGDAIPQWSPAAPTPEQSVAVQAVPVRTGTADPVEAAAWRDTPRVVWPAPGRATVDLPAGGPLAADRQRAGDLPILVGAPSKGQRASRVVVELLDRAAAQQAGVEGLLLRVGTTGGAASLAVDYRAFRYAYGGDWASRLRLVTLPSCAASAPQREECRVQTPVAAASNGGTGTASGDVNSADGPDLLVALAAAGTGGAGDYKATSLAPSASWQVSTQSGDFAWNYPLRFPPAAGDLTPGVGLSYSSGGIDGRIATTNNQTSWVGEGWDLSPGFVERRYRGCIDDGVSTKPGDLCWAGDYVNLSLDGHSSELLLGADGTYHLREDDGSKVERLTGAVNGDNDGEYWKVTTTDGTQYFFGRNRLPGWAAGKPETRSAWTVPVFGDDAGEPCYSSSGFASSWCQQAYRWNLDLVVDIHGNVLTHYYETETNGYGRNNTASANTSYVRGGYPLRTEYGLRAGGEYATPTARVLYTVSERCLVTSDFDCAPSKLTSANAARWPDVPFDRICDAGATCTNKLSPTFFTRKRLTKVLTQVWGGTAFRDVDAWSLTHAYPATGDGLGPTLWLEAISHAGLVGGSTPMPDVNFDGVQLTNRVDGLEGLAPMIRWRVQAVKNETGGTLSVTYSGQDCVRGTSMPAAPESNTRRCFPIYWTPEGSFNPIQDWFHKYVTSQVVSIDNTGGAPFDVTSYEYVGGTAWHHDDDELTPANRRTWSQWRGYSRVRVVHGDTGDTRSQTEHLFYRGMDGDKLPSGTRSATVVDSEGVSVPDTDRLRGFEREEIVSNGPGGAVVTGEINDPWVSGPTATQGTRSAYRIETAATRSREALAAGGWQRTETRTSFDSYGAATQVDDLGDVSTAADDQCIRTWYTRNTGVWLLDTVSREETVAKACSAATVRPDDVISDERHYYDGSTTWGATPTKGDETRMEEVTSWSGGPVYTTLTRSTYDAHGRVLDVYDAGNGRTSTGYTPATGGPVTQTTQSNQLGHLTTTTLEPAWGVPTATVDPNGKRTTMSYDPLGRLVKVWLPGRATTASASLEFAYLVRTNGPNAVTTRHLRSDGTYTVSHELFDGLLRPRQTQSPAPGGGRIVTDTFYDSRGLVAKRNSEFYNSAAPDTSLVAVADNQVPSQVLTTHDGVDRETVEAFRILGVEKWRTTTTYGGDRVTVDPPDGGTPSTTIMDARDRMVELRQYRGSSPTGSYDAARYTYAKDGQLATVTDAAGNLWRSTYDIAGNRVMMEEPDSGTTTMTYDLLDRLATVRDARGRTAAYSYDAIGRQTGVFDTSTSGTRLASFVYDTLAKGFLTSSTRWVGGDAYGTAYTGYNDDYQPTGTSVSIPMSEGALAGTYTTSATFNLDGTVNTMTMPAAGGLSSETLTLGYNELAMPTTLTSPLGTYTADTTYAKLGMPTQTRHGIVGKRIVRDYTYQEGTGRLLRATLDRETPTASRQSDVSYAYDQAGNITRVADTPPTDNAPSDIQCFKYDSLRRLTDAWTSDSACGSPSLNATGAAPYWHSYTYDVTGNRLSELLHGGGGDTIRTYHSPAAGQAKPHTVTSVDQTGPGGTRADTFGYDAVGNTTSRTVAGVTQSLEWDLEGHLSKATEGTKVTSYLYDADGNRLIRRDPGSVTLYLGSTELKLSKVAGVVTGTRYYSDGEDTIAVRTYDGTLTWQVPDHQGTSLLSVNSSTLAVTRRLQTPFGAPRGAVPVGWKGERGFVDGNADPTTGLTHLGAREYDPALGLFLSVDPMMNPEEPQAMHGYLYANNNPVSLSDPDGLCWPSWACKKAQQARDWLRDQWEAARRRAEAIRQAIARRIAELRRRAAALRQAIARKLAELKRAALRKAAELRRAAARRLAELKAAARRKLIQARDWARRKAQQVKRFATKTVPAVVKRVWHVTRFAINLQSTAVGLAYAKASGADCGMAAGLMVTCTGATRFAPWGGQTIGNVFTTRSSSVDPELLEHEARHSTQYTWFGGNPIAYGVNYAVASGVSSAIFQFKGPIRDDQGNVLCGQNRRTACYNAFEIDADLQKGGYLN